ncbi:MAG: YdcF family protein [Acidimicrobiia bacterium]
MTLRRLVKVAAVLVGLGVLYFAVTFVQVWSAARRDSARPADAIVVLGAAQYDGEPSPALRLRLDHAADLYERGLAPVVVLTGGRREGDRFTEAMVGFLHLRAAGIPESALRIENQGTNTWESLAAAAQFLRGEGIREVVLVTSPYHALRVEHIAADVGLDGHASPARSASGLGGLPSLVREAAAVGVGRIIGYHRLVDLDHRVDGALAPVQVTDRAAVR